MSQYTYKKESVGKSKVSLEVTISNEYFKETKDKIFAKESKEIKLPGFRPGKAPKIMMETAMGTKLIEKTLDQLLPDITEEIIKKEELDLLTKVDYELVSAEPEKDIVFKATSVLFPEIKIGNLKKMKVEKKHTDITDKEVDESYESIRKESQGKDKSNKEEESWIKELNIGVETKDQLKAKIKEELQKQKEYIDEQNYLKDIMEEAVKITKFDMPEELLESEKHSLEHRYTHQIENLGLKLEDFLKTQNTTLEELRKKWADEAESRIKRDLLLAKVTKDHKLEVKWEEIKAELDAISDEKLQKEYATVEGVNRIANVIAQQKALRKLVELFEQEDK